MVVMMLISMLPFGCNGDRIPTETTTSKDKNENDTETKRYFNNDNAIDSDKYKD